METSNDIVTVFYEHNFELQLFYGRLLKGIAFNKGLMLYLFLLFFSNHSRYKKFNFSSRVSEFEPAPKISQDYTKLKHEIQNMTSYSSYLMGLSRSRMASRMSKIYGYFNDLTSDNRQIFFEKNISFFTHELNGTRIYNNMSIYQGYFLTVSNLITELST